MDTQLIRNLYNTVRQAAKILGKEAEDAALLAKIAEQMPSSYFAAEQGKVAPNVIAPDGLIEEFVRGDVTFELGLEAPSMPEPVPTVNFWTNVSNPFFDARIWGTEAGQVGPNRVSEYGIRERPVFNSNAHRHVSQLWEMYPGRHLSAYGEDPVEKELFEAYVKSVEGRGPGSGQGWGLAWRINLSARAFDGDKASERIEQIFRTRTSPNLFGQHPNYQIDGNFGFTAGVIEMLMQSHRDVISILPALPKTWEKGEFCGFKAIGGSLVSAKWESGVATEVRIVATHSGEMRVANKDIAKAEVRNAAGQTIESTLNRVKNMRTFTAVEGETYIISGFVSRRY
jgi:hypothetical protein